MKSIRKPTFTEAVTPIVSMFFILLVGRGIYGAPIETLLIISSSIAAFIAWRVGLSWDDMIEGVSEKIAKAMPAILILIAVGIVVGTWMLSGTIPMLIYYGIQIVNPKFFFVTAFIICAILSTCTGTSWGSCATIGVVLIVIAQGLGIPLPITAAAVVGGSYFGDKMSPLSDTTNLAPLAAGANIFDHIRHMFYTTIPASLATLAIYAVLGFRTNAEVITGTETIEGMLDNISSIFNLNVVVLFIPVIIILIGSITRKPTIPVMLLSSLSAGIIAVVFQGFTIQDFLNVTVNGFSLELVAARGIDTSQILPEISKLLNRGGISSMMETIRMILCAFSFAGIITKSGCLDVILQKLLEYVKNRAGLIISTMASTILMAITTGSDFLTILIPGELFADAYKKMGLASRNLSRTLEDCGTCVVALIPWSAAGAYCAGVLGVPVLEYLPYSFFGFFSVLMALICAITGYGILSLDDVKKHNKKRRS